jgi:predicted peroxiredoxin
MAEKLIIVMANTDPRNGEELGAPIFQATVAAAMDYEVDVICTATSGRLMKKGVAEKLFVKEGSPKSVYSFIQDAHEAGAKFYCCSPNLDLFDMTQDDLIPECEGIVGKTAASFPTSSQGKPYVAFFYVPDSGIHW